MTKKANTERFCEGLEQLMHERRREVDEELRALHQREESIKESIVSRKTQRGKPLTERGLRALLSEFGSVHAQYMILYMEGSSIAKRQAVHQHNQWIAALADAERAA